MIINNNNNNNNKCKKSLCPLSLVVFRIRAVLDLIYFVWITFL